MEWQRKGYILKVRRGFYCFEERRKDERFLYFSANKIYAPSYVSFESALAHYSFIPEGIFITTSSTTRNTTSYETLVGNFVYRHLKPVLFFGYKLIRDEGFPVKIAEPEKVILDYFYLNKLNTIDEMRELRLNEIQIKEIIDFEKLSEYQKAFGSKTLDKRMRQFKKVINA